VEATRLFGAVPRPRWGLPLLVVEGLEKAKPLETLLKVIQVCVEVVVISSPNVVFDGGTTIVTPRIGRSLCACGFFLTGF
jgi:hypothetical protein